VSAQVIPSTAEVAEAYSYLGDGVGDAERAAERLVEFDLWLDSERSKSALEAIDWLSAIFTPNGSLPAPIFQIARTRFVTEVGVTTLRRVEMHTDWCGVVHPDYPRSVLCTEEPGHAGLHFDVENAARGLWSGTHERESARDD